MEAREYIIRHSDLYEPFQPNDKKRKAEDLIDDDVPVTIDETSAEDVVLRPSSPVLKIMKSLATNISKTLSTAQTVST